MAFAPDEWRKGLLTGGTRLVAVFGTLTLVGFYTSLIQTPIFFMTCALGLIAFWVSGFREHVPLRVHATLLVTAGLSLHFVSMVNVGFRVITPLSSAFMMIVAALMTDRRGAMTTWALITLGDCAVVVLDGGQGGAAVWPASDEIVWRYVVTMALFNGFSGAGVTAAVEMLSENVAELDAHVLSLERATQELHSEREKVIALQKMDLVGKLAAGIAHDFNNDLQVIIGWSDMLVEDIDEVDRQGILEACEQIGAASDHASNLVAQLLTLGKRHVGVPEAIALGSFIERMTPSIRRLLSNEVTLEVLVERDLVALIDPIQLHQVMLNLCLNARDAMPAGGRLGVRLRDDGERLRVCVSDTGVGIPEEVRARIFDPFFSTKGEERGTGLGLSTVRQIVEDAGGEISVESTPGAGSTFSVSLPSVEASAVDEGSDAESLTYRLDGMDVMVVEDDAAVREVMTRALQIAGASVRVAVDATDAIDALGSRMVDVVFSDAIMPRGGVAPLYEWLSSLGEQAPPLILCSAYIESELVRRGVKAEEIMLLRKPFSPSLLVKTAAELRRPAE